MGPLSRGGAIKAYCKECMEEAKSTGDCGADYCPLYPWQPCSTAVAVHGHGVTTTAICNMCFDCVEFHSKTIEDCIDPECPLYQWSPFKEDGTCRN